MGKSELARASCGEEQVLVLVQREQELRLREGSEVLGTTMLSNQVIQTAGWPSTAASRAA